MGHGLPMHLLYREVFSTPFTRQRVRHEPDIPHTINNLRIFSLPSISCITYNQSSCRPTLKTFSHRSETCEVHKLGPPLQAALLHSPATLNPLSPPCPVAMICSPSFQTGAVPSSQIGRPIYCPCREIEYLLRSFD